MNGRLNRLFCVTLIAILVVAVSGCDQPANVIAPTSTTELTLNPVRLFDPPQGYAYALWVIDTLDEASYVDIFSWDHALYKFRDTSGNAIDNVWDAKQNVLDPKYRFVAMSIEQLSNFDTTAMGPIMLMDTIVDPNNYTMQMVFPLHVWETEGSFCMETPTDGNSNSNEASGVWFALYVYDSLIVRDTTNLIQPSLQSLKRQFSYDTLHWVCNTYDGENCIDSTFVPLDNITSPDDYDYITVDSLGNLDVTYYVCTATDIDDNCIDSTGYDRETEISQGIQYDWIVVNTLDTIGYVNKDCGHTGELLTGAALYNNNVDTAYLDTISYNYCTFEWYATPVNISNSIRKDTVRFDSGNPITFNVEPFTDYIHKVNYTSAPTIRYIDRFITGFDTEVSPDLEGTGWHYRGWVLAPSGRISPTDFGTLTKPAWTGAAFNLYLDPIDGGVVSTGAFYRFDYPDIENAFIQRNPYASPNMARVPPFPGEDFLNTSTLPGGAQLNFIQPGETHPVGKVLITLEPDNYWDPNDNFPLILMSSALPSYSAISINHPHSTANFDLANLYHITSVGYGMPTISLKIAVK